jgi:hypothetical protein
MCDNEDPCKDCKIEKFCNWTDGKIQAFALLKQAKCEFGDFFRK